MSAARPRGDRLRLVPPLSPARRAELHAIQKRHPSHRCDAQRCRLLEALVSHRDGITTLQARECLDVLAVGARIAEMRACGLPILGERVRDVVRGIEHTRVMRYWVAPSVACQLREAEAPALAELVAGADVAEAAP